MLLSGRDDLRTIAAAFVATRERTDPIDLLSRYSSCTRTLEQATRQLVDQLRANGASWTTIGRELGVTKQAAQQRYGAATRPVATPDGSTLHDALGTEQA